MTACRCPHCGKEINAPKEVPLEGIAAHVQSFLIARCTLQPERSIPRNELRGHYEDWCREVGYRPISPQRLTTYLRGLSYSFGGADAGCILEGWSASGRTWNGVDATRPYSLRSRAPTFGRG